MSQRGEKSIPYRARPNLLATLLSAFLLLTSCHDSAESPEEDDSYNQPQATIGVNLSAPGWVPTDVSAAAPQLESAELQMMIGQFSWPETHDDVAWIGPYVTVEPGLLVQSASNRGRGPEHSPCQQYCEFNRASRRCNRVRGVGLVGMTRSRPTTCS